MPLESRRIVGGLAVAVALVFAAGAAAEPAPEPPRPPAMENLWPPLEVSFPLQMTLESNPLRFRCQAWGNVTWADYTWRLSTSPATEGEGLLGAAQMIASGGGSPLDPGGAECRAVPSSQHLAPGNYYWQVSRPKQPGPGVEVGPVGTFTVGPSAECRKMQPILAKAKLRVAEDTKRLRAARDQRARRKIRERLEGRKIDLIRVKHNRRYFCRAGAGDR
ncbi:MAG: hypothetical protein JST08_13340 [Actinobacteria bacterium]|nr:hypothetical protein [Actinomycetota bacterium]